MKYIVKGKLSLKDYKDFLTASLIYKKHRLVILILCLVIVMFNCITSLIGAPDLISAFSDILPVLIFLLLYFAFYNFYTRRSFKTDPVMQTEMTYTFSEEGIHWETENGTYNYKKEDFKRFIFAKKIIAIYISNRKAILIPRHFFESREQEKEIEVFIKDNLMNQNQN